MKSRKKWRKQKEQQMKRTQNEGDLNKMKKTEEQLTKQTRWSEITTKLRKQRNI